MAKSAAEEAEVIQHCTLPALQHNNTTPDDIGICEAYLAFLRAGGDNGAYWRVLDSHGERTILQIFAAGRPPEDSMHQAPVYCVYVIFK